MNKKKVFKILNMYKEGKTIAKIKSTTDCSHSQIYYICSGHYFKDWHKEFYGKKCDKKSSLCKKCGIYYVPPENHIFCNKCKLENYKKANNYDLEEFSSIMR